MWVGESKVGEVWIVTWMYPARVLKTPQKGYFTVWGSGDSVFLFYDDDDDVQPRGTPFRFCTPCAGVSTLVQIRKLCDNQRLDFFMINKLPQVQVHLTN
jgi:hypothetical protein